VTTKPTAHYLRDLLAELADITAFTAKGRDAFASDRMAQKAVIRSYEVIGEIVKRIPPEIRQTNPQIDWRKLAGFRDFLAHNYDRVIFGNVWSAVEDLPNLRAAVETLLHTVEANEVRPDDLA
jgi:uncharacterized protein with HEPN domain